MNYKLYFSFSFKILDLEDIRILTEEKLHKDGEKTKNPQQNLQLLDELIKTRIKPKDNDLKIDVLASKSNNLNLTMILFLFIKMCHFFYYVIFYV